MAKGKKTDGRVKTDRIAKKSVPSPAFASSTAEDFEKLGVFYLGRPYDLAAKQAKPEWLLYDSKDLVTHRANELTMANQHDRSMAGNAKRGTTKRTGERLLGSLAPLLEGEVRKAEHEFLWSGILTPWDLETPTTVREQRKCATGRRLLAIDADFAAQHSPQGCTGVLELDADALGDRIELK